MFKVVKVRDGKKETVSVSHYIEEAERSMVDVVSSTISNFDEYDAKDIYAIMDQRYENFGSGCVYIEEDGEVPEGVNV